MDKATELAQSVRAYFDAYNDWVASGNDSNLALNVDSTYETMMQICDDILGKEF